jgi:hypothetical protein
MNFCSPISQKNTARKVTTKAAQERFRGIRVGRIKTKRGKHSQHTEFEERERKAEIIVNAARYEYKSSSDSEKLYLSAGRPHRRSVEHKTETSLRVRGKSEDEEDDDERSDKKNSPDQKVMAACSNPKAVTPNQAGYPPPAHTIDPSSENH